MADPKNTKTLSPKYDVPKRGLWSSELQESPPKDSAVKEKRDYYDEI